MYWNAVWTAKTVRHTVRSLYRRLKRLINNNYSGLEDMQCTIVGLRVGSMACETTSLSYVPPSKHRLRPLRLSCDRRISYELYKPKFGTRISTPLKLVVTFPKYNPRLVGQLEPKWSSRNVLQSSRSRCQFGNVLGSMAFDWDSKVWAWCFAKRVFSVRHSVKFSSWAHQVHWAPCCAGLSTTFFDSG